ncbi:MAG: glycosyltransferase family 87 protein [Pseudomonadota bacterium]
MLRHRLQKIAAELRVIGEPRLRVAILGGLVTLAMFAAHFSRLFLPGEIAVGAAQQDYAAFYGAARAALIGFEGDLYDPAVFQEAIGAQTTLLWLYPPPMLIMLAPFALLPYGAAKIFWALAGLGLAFVLMRMASGSRPVAAIAALGPVSFAALFVGQISALFALLLTAGLLQAKARPILAGACFAALTVKPQYGLLVIPFLIIMGAWRAMLAATGFTLLLVGASAAIYGPEMWFAFFSSVFEGVHAAYYQSDGHAGRITLSDAIKAAGLAAPPALALYLPLIAGAAAALWFVAQRTTYEMSVAFALAATALIGPYLFVYDYYIVAAAVLIVATRRGPSAAIHVYPLMALWFAPLVPFIGGSPATPAFLWPVMLAGTAAIGALAIRQDAEKPVGEAARKAMTPA